MVFGYSPCNYTRVWNKGVSLFIQPHTFPDRWDCISYSGLDSLWINYHSQTVYRNISHQRWNKSCMYSFAILLDISLLNENNSCMQRTTTFGCCYRDTSSDYEIISALIVSWWLFQSNCETCVSLFSDSSARIFIVKRTFLNLTRFWVWNESRKFWLHFDWPLYEVKLDNSSLS